MLQIFDHSKVALLWSVIWCFYQATILLLLGSFPRKNECKLLFAKHKRVIWIQSDCEVWWWWCETCCILVMKKPVQHVMRCCYDNMTWDFTMRIEQWGGVIKMIHLRLLQQSKAMHGSSFINSAPNYDTWCTYLSCGSFRTIGHDRTNIFHPCISSAQG